VAKESQNRGEYFRDGDRMQPWVLAKNCAAMETKFQGYVPPLIA
jgi:hypothetical protein